MQPGKGWHHLRNAMPANREHAMQHAASPPSSKPGPRLAREHEGAGKRGRAAANPWQVPLQGWKDVLLRTKDEVQQDQIALTAAAVAFYAMLAIFPGLIGLVSIYGLLFDPAEIEAHVSSVSALLPSEARVLLMDYLHETVQRRDETLGVAAIAGLLAALWSASSGTASTMTAINIAYDEVDKRGFIRSRVIALGLTLAFIIVVVIALALLTVLPFAMDTVGLSRSADTFISWIRWPLLVLLGLLGLAVLYRFVPDRTSPKWRWVTPGSLVAVTLWILVSSLFSLYASHYGNFGQTYGPLASVMVLLLWLYLSSFALLLGAELNAELEAQTKIDSTIGPAKPMGQRGAQKADHLGEARGR